MLSNKPCVTHEYGVSRAARARSISIFRKDVRFCECDVAHITRTCAPTETHIDLCQFRKTTTQWFSQVGSEKNALPRRYATRCEAGIDRTPYPRSEAGLSINPSNLVRVDNVLMTHNKSGCPAEKRACRFFETRNLIKQGKERWAQWKCQTLDSPDSIGNTQRFDSVAGHENIQSNKG